MVIERRKYRRFTVEGMDFQCRMMKAIEAQLVNISIGGCSIRIARKLDIGASYKLKIQNGESVIALSGVVIWATMEEVLKNKADEFTPVYEIGLRFENVLSSNGMVLSSFIEECSAEHRGRLRVLGLRVKLKDSSTAVVSEYDPCLDVLKISFGGMLIESAQPIDLGKTFPMELIYPDKRDILEMQGQVVYCSKMEGKSPPAWEIGIGFMDMEEPVKTKFNELICALAFND